MVWFIFSDLWLRCSDQSLGFAFVHLCYSVSTCARRMPWCIERLWAEVHLNFTHNDDNTGCGSNVLLGGSWCSKPRRYNECAHLYHAVSSACMTKGQCKADVIPLSTLFDWQLNHSSEQMIFLLTPLLLIYRVFFDHSMHSALPLGIYLATKFWMYATWFYWFWNDILFIGVERHPSSCFVETKMITVSKLHIYTYNTLLAHYYYFACRITLWIFVKTRVVKISKVQAFQKCIA